MSKDAQPQQSEIKTMKVRSGKDGDPQIGQTLKRIGALQNKGLLGQDQFRLEAVGIDAAWVAMVVAQNKGGIKALDYYPHTLPNGIDTRRFNILVDTRDTNSTAGKQPPTTKSNSWNVCAPRGGQTMRTSCAAFDAKLEQLGVGQTIKLLGSGNAIKTLLVFMGYLEDEYADYCSIVGRSTANVYVENPNNGRSNKKTVMHLWITKHTDWNSAAEKQEAEVEQITDE